MSLHRFLVLRSFCRYITLLMLIYPAFFLSGTHLVLCRVLPDTRCIVPQNQLLEQRLLSAVTKLTHCPCFLRSESAARTSFSLCSRPSRTAFSLLLSFLFACFSNFRRRHRAEEHPKHLFPSHHAHQFVHRAIHGNEDEQNDLDGPEVRPDD